MGSVVHGYVVFGGVGLEEGGCRWRMVWVEGVGRGGADTGVVRCIQEDGRVD